MAANPRTISAAYGTPDPITGKSLQEIIDAAPEHLRGCDKCRFGVLPTATEQQFIPNTSIVERWLLQWRQGELHLCDCAAGQAKRRYLEKLDADNASLETQMQAAAEQARQRRAARIFQSAQVPEKYANLSFADYVRICKGDSGKADAVAAIKEFKTNGRIETQRGPRPGILLYGPTDMGKTGALSPLFLSFVRGGRSGLWVQYNDLLAALRQFKDGQVEERIESCKRMEYLFVDDFGDPAAEGNATDYTRDVIFRIIDHRYGYGKTTFITSNLSPAQMSRQFHERVTRRLAELCAIIGVSGQPMRDLLIKDSSVGS